MGIGMCFSCQVSQDIVSLLKRRIHYYIIAMSTTVGLLYYVFLKGLWGLLSFYYLSKSNWFKYGIFQFFVLNLQEGCQYCRFFWREVLFFYNVLQFFISVIMMVFLCILAGISMWAPSGLKVRYLSKEYAWAWNREMGRVQCDFSIMSSKWAAKMDFFFRGVAVFSHLHQPNIRQM